MKKFRQKKKGCQKLNELWVVSVHRHPIQEVCCSPFVPNDTLSNTNNGKMKVLTGPNASGKSVYLKQVTQSVIRLQPTISLFFRILVCKQCVIKWCGVFSFTLYCIGTPNICICSALIPPLACFFDIPNWPKILLICYMPWPTSPSLMLICTWFLFTKPQSA